MIDMKAGLEEMGLTLTEKQLVQLDKMLDLLNAWNERHNLTRYKTREEQVIYHIFDALSAHRFFSSYKVILDIGTGAGFPGIPLAVMYPEKKFHLVDSNGKKIAYLKQVIKVLSLSNVSVYHERAEDLEIENIDVVTARALASPEAVKQLVAHLGDHLHFILYVGKSITEGVELLEVPGSNKVHGILTC